MTTDPRTPNHTTTTCSEKYYPFYIGGSTHVFLENAYVDSFGNYLLSGWGYGGPYSWSSGTKQAFVAL